MKFLREKTWFALIHSILMVHTKLTQKIFFPLMSTQYLAGAEHSACTTALAHCNNDTIWYLKWFGNTVNRSALSIYSTHHYLFHINVNSIPCFICSTYGEAESRISLAKPLSVANPFHQGPASSLPNTSDFCFLNDDLTFTASSLFWSLIFKSHTELHACLCSGISKGIFI